MLLKSTKPDDLKNKNSPFPVSTCSRLVTCGCDSVVTEIQNIFLFEIGYQRQKKGDFFSFVQMISEFLPGVTLDVSVCREQDMFSQSTLS